MSNLEEKSAHVESECVTEQRDSDKLNTVNGYLANAVSPDTVKPDAIFQGIRGGELSTVESLRHRLGNNVVLLHIPKGAKGPRTQGWQKSTVQDMGNPEYLRRLDDGNIGVLLGGASGGLCAIDIDDDDEVAPFLEVNPSLAGTLRTKGRRGEQIWVKVLGPVPKLTALKTKGGSNWGEWRADGGQSVVHGVHPDGMAYQFVVDARPVDVVFEDINWPKHLVLPWAAEVQADYDECQALVETDGEPFTVSSKGSVVLNQVFFVKKYMLEHEVLYEASLADFYEYSPADGLWKRKSPESIKRCFSDDLTKIAKETNQHAIYQKRTDALLTGLVALLKSHAEREGCFGQRPRAIHVANGMICFEGNEVLLKSFHPDFLSRNACPYAYDAKAECPRFIKELLLGSLDEDDVRLVQKWAGGVLLGRNDAQRILLLVGMAGGGKTTLMDVLERIAGPQNVAQLRTEHLGGRFELFGFVGKTLLTGKDVAADFLMQRGAITLKALVGGDSLEAEKKGSNDHVRIKGDFNVGVTANTDLIVRLEGDGAAWKRRLMVIKYERPAPARRIANFADTLLAEEGPGILRWMVDGAIMLLNDLDETGDIILTPAQKQRVESLLSQSESVRCFIKSCVQRQLGGQISAAELLSAYYDFCSDKGWQSLPERAARSELAKMMAEIHGACQRHDLNGTIGGVRGYKHFAFVEGGAA